MKEFKRKVMDFDHEVYAKVSYTFVGCCRPSDGTSYVCSTKQGKKI